MDRVPLSFGQSTKLCGTYRPIYSLLVSLGWEEGQTPTPKGPNIREKLPHDPFVGLSDPFLGQAGHLREPTA